MKDYKKLMEFCKDLGLQPLGKDGRGHTVYGDPTLKGIIFSDSSPHNNHISEAYYSEARRCAEELKSAKRSDVVETFVASPLTYEATYRYLAVYNICTDVDGKDIHEVFSPDMRNAFGSGADLCEAKEDAQVRLDCAVANMIARGENIQPASTRETVAKIGAEQKRHADGFTVRFKDLVELCTTDKATTMSDVEELAPLDEDVVDLWRSLARRCVMT